MKQTTKKHYEVSFEVEPKNTSLLIAEAFGIGPGWINHIVDVTLPDPLPQIVLISGESGCGKSTLLRQLGKTTKFEAPNKPLHAWCEPDEKALQLLNSVGLNDASLFLLHYGQLSDSQQARARMYFWLCQGETTLIVDEFLATLDRETAHALAFSFQHMLRREGIRLIAATAQNDLIPFLQPDLVVEGRAFPSRWTTQLRSETKAITNPFDKAVTIEQETGISNKVTPGGTCKNCGKGVQCKCKNPEKSVSRGKDAYQQSRLGEIHYKGKYVGGKQEYFSARMGDDIVGWLVGTMSRNASWRIARVVVHPTYRSCGIGKRLIRAYLKLRPDAYTVAAMARFNPVFERAGMQRVDDLDLQPPTCLKGIPLTPAQWADKSVCEKLLETKKYLDIMVTNADKLGVDTHPRGIRPGEPGSSYTSMKQLFRDFPNVAAQALWRQRPHRLAKYVGPKHPLYTLK